MNVITESINIKDSPWARLLAEDLVH